MKLKHLFFSSLLLSTAFVACTNEDILENPSMDAKEGIALGEGFTINVANGIESRAAFNKTTFSPYWQNGDKIGAAWFNEVTALKADDETKVTENAASWDKFYSNHPFELSQGAGTNNGTFTSVTNAFAGAYVLYYPFDATISRTKGVIPVQIDARQSMDCASGKEWNVVNENMFAYGVAKFVPGGPTTDDFSLSQIPVLYQLNFKVADQTYLGLLKNFYIEKVIVEAKKDDATVLVTEGQLAPSTAAVTSDSYNKNELPNADYSWVKKVDHLSIDLSNSNNSNYQITALDKATVKPFIFSALPFAEEADEVTFKIVASNGAVFAKTYNAEDHESIIAAINGTADLDEDGEADEDGAAFQGGQVKMTVTIDELVNDGIIYTEEQFEAEWKKAMSSTKDYELIIGENLELNKALTFKQVNNKDVTISAHCDNHSVTINGLEATKGTLNFNTPLVVKGDVLSTIAEFNAVDLTAENVEIEGTADIAARSINKLYIAPSGDVTLTEADNVVGTSVANIEIDATTRKMGELSLSNFDVKDMTNLGDVYVKASVVAYGTVTNKASFILEDNFDNKGTFNQEGEVVTDTYTFNNNAGATLNLKVVENGANYVNAAMASDGTAAGIINVEVGTKVNPVLLGDASVNNGTININDGGYLRVNHTLQNSESTGVINVFKGGTLSNTENTAIKGGKVNMKDLDAVVGSRIDEDYVYYSVNNKTTDAEWTALASGKLIKDNVYNLVVTGNVVINNAEKKSAFASHRIFLEADMKLTEDLELYWPLVVSGTASISSDDNTVMRTLTIASEYNKIMTGAKLTLNKVTLSHASAAEIAVEGTGAFVKNTGGLSCVTIKY